MKQLHLQSKIESELKIIIKNAVQSGKIDKETLRMVILCPDRSFGKLAVYTSNEWESYFYKEDQVIIGEIDISKWLDVADEALESKQTIDDCYLESAKEINKKYAEKKPAVSFSHFESIDKKYTAFLVCLREELITQIEIGIANAATAFCQDDFHHIIGFFTHGLTFNAEDKVLLHGFNHPEGTGTFYKAELTVPNNKYSDHYMRFTADGFVLFSYKGTLFKKSAAESEVYSYAVKDIVFMCRKNNEIHFRLKDEFQNYILEPVRKKALAGKPSDKDFYEAFEAIFEAFPEKTISADQISNPITEKKLFDNWFSLVLEYNIEVTFGNRQTIFNFGEEAYRYYLQQIPKTNVQHEPAVRFYAEKLFFENRFQESIAVFDTVKVLSDFQKIQNLCAFLFLDKKKEYDTLRSTIEIKSEQPKLELLDLLWILREPLETEELLTLAEELSTLLIPYKNNEKLHLLSVVLTKIYVSLNDQESALLQLQSVPTHETFEKVILLQELKNVDYILQAYEKQAYEKQRNIAFDKQVEVHSLNTTKESKKTIKKTNYEYCYYVSHKIDLSKYTWACPLSAEIFVATRKQEECNELIIARITEQQSLKILQQLELPSTIKAASGVYLDGVVYLCDKEHGIVSYIVNEQMIEQSTIVYKNKKVKANYENFTIADGYLYASNRKHLEIYNLQIPGENLISDAFYIQSGYHLFVHNNLLVVGAGCGILILVDISDKMNPIVYTTIKESKTPDNMHIAFVGDYMVSQSLYNIQDPSKPSWISIVEKDLAPTYYFTKQPKVPIISTGEEFLLTTIAFENDHAIYTNWRECLNKDNWYYETAGYNFCTAYFEDVLITYSPYEIIFWKKELSPIAEQINVHETIKKMVHTCFQYLTEEHPDFNIGKVVLQHNKLYQHIDIAFHASSSLAILTDSTIEHELPIISSTFLFQTYCQEILECQYNGMKMQFVYDCDSIMAQLQHRFKEHLARHVLLLTDNEATYIYNPDKPWKPFRINTSEKKEENKATLAQIILSKNENLIQQLSDGIAEDSVLLDELLEILNKKIYIPTVKGELTNRLDQSNHDLYVEDEPYEYIENTNIYDDEWYCSPMYIVDPYLSPETEETQTEVAGIQGEVEITITEYFENNDQTHHLKTKALEILCLLPNYNLVRDILLNGMQFGYLHYDLKKAEPVYNPREKKLIAYPDQQLLISYFLDNYHNLWNNFGSDNVIHSFLISNLNTFENEQLQLKIVYKMGQLNHPVLSQFISSVINEGITYDVYKGNYTGINLSVLPAEVLKPFERQLLEKAVYLENSIKNFAQLDAEQQVLYIYALLYQLGHQHMPDLVSKKLLQAVKKQEQYGTIFSDDEEYEEESAFFTKLYRKIKVKRLLEYYNENNGALWPLQESLELYQESWDKTIEAVFTEGKAIFGPAFKTDYIQRLVAHIPLDESFASDRIWAVEIIKYTYKHIVKKPEMASLAEPLVLAILVNKEVFETIDVSALKDKNKYTLLQAAWNDLKNQDWDLAEQKADAVLIMDPAMAQVYFLKARLLWLREGISAYLAKQDYFIDKSAHDITALARLYNLTGCALDVEKRYEEALCYFKKAALSTPTDPIYIANVAEIYYKLGKPDEAVKHAKIARENGNEGEILNEIIENKGVLINS